VGTVARGAVAVGVVAGAIVGEGVVFGFTCPEAVSEVTGAGWFSGKNVTLSVGVRASAEYSKVQPAFLHFNFAPSLSRESKVREVPLAKDKVTGLLPPAALA